MGVPSNYGDRLNPTIPIDQSIYEQSTTKKTELGTKLQIGDRTFRYAKAGTGQLGVNPGRICCGPDAPGTHGGTFVSFAVATTGATSLSATVGGGAITADMYADGYVVFGGGTRAGEVYKIRSNDTGAAGTGLTAVGITLYDPIVGTVTATSLGALQLSRYTVAVKTAATAGDAVGAAMIAVTEGNYFWLQTKGPAGIIAAATPGAWKSLVLGTTGVVDAAAISLTTGQDNVIVAKNGAEAGVAAKATPVILMLE